jgi:hypothetical protein
MKLIVKLAIAALVANAAWRVGTTYVSYYRFKDSVQEAAQFSGNKSDEELRQRVLELASEYDVPVGEDDFTVRRDANHTFVDGAFKKPIQVLPGYTYPWPFEWKIDVFTVNPVGAPQ